MQNYNLSQNTSPPKSQLSLALDHIPFGIAKSVVRRAKDESSVHTVAFKDRKILEKNQRRDDQYEVSLKEARRKFEQNYSKKLRTARQQRGLSFEAQPQDCKGVIYGLLCERGHIR